MTMAEAWSILVLLRVVLVLFLVWLAWVAWVWLSLPAKRQGVIVLPQGWSSNYPPPKAQGESMDTVEITGVHLVRQGAYAVVRVEIDGKWVEVIREHVDGNFSHIIEVPGIQQCAAKTS